MFDEDWFTGKSKSSKSFISRKKKEWEDRQETQQVAVQEAKTKAAKDQKKKEDSKSPLSHLTDAIGGFGKTLVSGLQQAGGNVADAALMGGSVIENIGIDTNPFTSEETKKKKRAESFSNTEFLRNAIKEMRTVTGERVNNKEDFQFTGDAGRDAANLAGRSLSVGLDATSLINPAKLGAAGAGGKLTAKEAAKFAARDAAFYGTGAAVAEGGRSYGEGNDADKALADAFGAGITTAATQGALDLGGYGVGRGISRAKNGKASKAPETQKMEVVQVVDPKTKEKTFYRIPSDQRDSIVSNIDNARDGSAIAGENIGGKVTHITARSPEDMAKRGFKDGGVYQPTEKNSDLNAVLNKAIEEQSDMYGKNIITRVKEAIGDQFNPNRAFAKIDDEYARATGTKRSKLPADESVEDLARRSAASEREAAGLFEKQLTGKLDDGTSVNGSAKELVKKYNGDSEAGKEFNNYTNAKFDLEFRDKKNKNGGDTKRIQNGVSREQLQQFVTDYEARNPDAIKDLRIKKAVNDEAVDYLVKSKAISEAEGAQIKSAYKNAVPLERVFADDLQRAEMNGRNIGSIAKQTVIQKLEGGSDIPLSNSFDTMLNRVYKAVSQGNRAKLSQKLLERSEQGHIKDNNTIRVTAGNKDARKAIREDVALVNKGIRTLQSKVKISDRQARRIEREIAKLNKEGLNVSLKEGGKAPLPDMNVGKLDKLSKQPGKNVAARQFFKSLVEADPADIKRIQGKIATREPKLAQKLDQVLATKAEIESLRAAKTDMRSVISDFTDDPTTGRQVISGVVEGQSFKIEVDPKLANAVQGLDQQKLGPVLKAFAIAKKPFEVAWTGIANPVFSGISFAFYDTPMSIINSPQGFKTLAPKAIVESFKSLSSSSEFQRALAANGARPYGGSGSSSFVKPDAKALAAQGSILKQIKYNAKNPSVALSNLDVFGGKLANATRSRVAYAAAVDSMKKQGIKNPKLSDIVNNEQALADATRAYRTIMPDFDTMSNLTRQINAVVPFYSASVAGTRSFGQALKRDPVNTSAKALALGVGPIIGVTAFSLGSPQGQEFYADMEKNSPTTLDNNMVVVLPGASKNKETGKWDGIIKIPLAPEFRAMNQSIWRAVRGASGGEGVSPEAVALSIFDTVTGGVRTSQNPYIDTIRTLAGEDTMTGERLIKGSMADLPKEEQAYASTSDAGRFIGKALNTSPIQGDKILGQFGLVGATAKNGGDPVGAITENVGKKFVGASGGSAANTFYTAYSPAKAARDKASREVTSLVKLGRIGEAKRKANEYNETIPGRFADYGADFLGEKGDSQDYRDMLSGLYIKTTENAFKARASQ